MRSEIEQYNNYKVLQERLFFGLFTVFLIKCDILKKGIIYFLAKDGMR